jgi:hypothetical protein
MCTFYLLNNIGLVLTSCGAAWLSVSLDKCKDLITLSICSKSLSVVVLPPVHLTCPYFSIGVQFYQVWYLVLFITVCIEKDWLIPYWKIHVGCRQFCNGQLNTVHTLATYLHVLGTMLKELRVVHLWIGFSFCYSLGNFHSGLFFPSWLLSSGETVSCHIQKDLNAWSIGDASRNRFSVLTKSLYLPSLLLSPCCPITSVSRQQCIPGVPAGSGRWLQGGHVSGGLSQASGL